jgi:CrcB protein
MSAGFIAAITAVLVGGGAAVLRYLVSVAFAGRGTLPWAVLTVNVVGSAVGGAVLGASQSGAASPDVRLILLGGLAGGLTTFSTWSVETIELVHRGHWRTALASVALNLGAGTAVATAAWALAR